MLKGTISLSTHNICFGWEITKLNFCYALLTKVLFAYQISILIMPILFFVLKLSFATVDMTDMYWIYTCVEGTLLNLIIEANSVVPGRTDPKWAFRPGFMLFAIQAKLFCGWHFGGKYTNDLRLCVWILYLCIDIYTTHDHVMVKEEINLLTY